MPLSGRAVKMGCMCVAKVRFFSVRFNGFTRINAYVAKNLLRQSTEGGNVGDTITRIGFPAILQEFFLHSGSAKILGK